MASLRERHPYKRDPDIFPPIKPDHAQAVGYVAIHWSFVEESLDVAIQFLLKLPPTTKAALLSELSTIPKMTMIRALIEASGEEELLSEWKMLTTEMDELRAKRNDVVHGVWEVVEPGHYLKR